MLTALAVRGQSDFAGRMGATGFAADAGDPRAWGRLEFAPRFTLGTRWQFRASGWLTAWSRGPAGRSRVVDPLERGPFQPAIQVEELALRRAWGSTLRGEFRAGILPIRWGRTDGFAPVDTVAPHDYTDLLDGRRPGVPALAFALRGSSSGVEFFFQPYFAPDRSPPGLLGAGGRWSAPLPTRLASPLPFPWDGEWTARYRVDPRDRPARSLRESEFGARWEWVGSRLELALSLRQGRERTARVAPVLEAIDPTARRLDFRLARTWPRERRAGLELLVPAGSVLWRAEAAWAEPRGGGRGTLLYTLEIETRRGDWNWIAAWGGIDDPGAAGAGPATGGDLAQGGLPALLLSARREVAGEWGASFSAIRDFDRGGWLARGAVSRPWGDALRIEAGVDLLGGPADSFFGLFKDEDRLRLQATWSF